MMKSLIATLAAAALFAAPALAQEEESTGWTGEGSLSASSTTGNTESTDIGAALKVKRDWGIWSTTAEAAADYGELDGVESKNRIFLAGQADRQINDRLYGFGRISYEQDEFTGFDSRTFVGGGLGYEVLQGPRATWNVEGGPGFKIDEVADILARDANGEIIRDGAGAPIIATPATTEESFAVIAKSDYAYAFNDAVTFSNLTNVIYAQESTQIGNTTAITAALTDVLSARVSFEVRHDTNPPMGFEDTDTATRFSIVYKLK